MNAPFRLPNRYRAIFVSDVHLGTKRAQTEHFLDFLRITESEWLYLVGDLVDNWALRKAWHWDQLHNDVIQKILRKARKGTRVIYIPGNHDELLGGHLGAYGAIAVQRHAFHLTADGRRMLIMHGHELDTVVQNMRWLAVCGELGYEMLLRLNPLVNAARRLFGFGYWSLSKYVKSRVKNAVCFISAYEEAVVHFAQKYRVHAVMCGHIHSPAERRTGAIEYYNCGDWVESCSAIVEHHDGRLELMNQFRPRDVTFRIPRRPAVALLPAA